MVRRDGEPAHDNLGQPAVRAAQVLDRHPDLVGRVPDLNIHFLHVAVILEDNHLPNAHRLVPVQFEPAADVMARNSRPTRFHAAVVGQRRSHALVFLKCGGLRL